MSLGPESLLGWLDDYVTRSGFVITPVVLWCDGDPTLTPDPDEVLAAYRIGLQALLDGEPRFIRIPESERPVLQLPLGNDLIHAPTGALLYQFREVGCAAGSGSGSITWRNRSSRGAEGARRSYTTPDPRLGPHRICTTSGDSGCSPHALRCCGTRAPLSSACGPQRRSDPGVQVHSDQPLNLITPLPPPRPKTSSHAWPHTSTYLSMYVEARRRHNTHPAGRACSALKRNLDRNTPHNEIALDLRVRRHAVLESVDVPGTDGDLGASGAAELGGGKPMSAELRLEHLPLSSTLGPVATTAATYVARRGRRPVRVG